MTMQIDSLSTTEVLGKRDAFHVPAVLVTSYGSLKGGDSVRFIDNDFMYVEKCAVGSRHAVISPFVGSVKPNEKVWAMLIPNKTSNLHHQFDVLITDLPDGPVTAAAKAEQEEVQEYLDDGCRGCW